MFQSIEADDDPDGLAKLPSMHVRVPYGVYRYRSCASPPVSTMQVTLKLASCKA